MRENKFNLKKIVIDYILLIAIQKPSHNPEFQIYQSECGASILAAPTIIFLDIFSEPTGGSSAAVLRKFKQRQKVEPLVSVEKEKLNK